MILEFFRYFTSFPSKAIPFSWPGTEGSGVSASALIVLLLAFMPFCARAKDGTATKRSHYQLKRFIISIDTKHIDMNICTYNNYEYIYIYILISWEWEKRWTKTSLYAHRFLYDAFLVYTRAAFHHDVNACRISRCTLTLLQACCYGAGRLLCTKAQHGAALNFFKLGPVHAPLQAPSCKAAVHPEPSEPSEPSEPEPSDRTDRADVVALVYSDPVTVRAAVRLRWKTFTKASTLPISAFFNLSTNKWAQMYKLLQASL